MCQPVNTTSTVAAIAAAIEIPADVVGSCGRRCRECKLAALTAGLTAEIPARMAARRTPATSQIPAFAK